MYTLIYRSKHFPKFERSAGRIENFTKKAKHARLLCFYGERRSPVSTYDALELLHLKA